MKRLKHIFLFLSTMLFMGLLPLSLQASDKTKTENAEDTPVESPISDEREEKHDSSDQSFDKNSSKDKPKKDTEEKVIDLFKNEEYEEALKIIKEEQLINSMLGKLEQTPLMLCFEKDQNRINAAPKILQNSNLDITIKDKKRKNRTWH